MKRYLPRGLFGRALLILLIPVVLVQVVVAVAIVQRHFEGVTRQLTEAAANEINHVLQQVEAAPDAAAARATLARASDPLDIAFSLEAGEIVPRDALRRFYDVTGGAMEEALKTGVRRPLTVDLLAAEKQVVAEVQTEKGVLRAVIDRNRLSASNPHQLFVWMIGTSLVFIAVAVVFLRNQVRPIRRLAAAAEAFGKGRPIAFTPAGAEEVRRAGAAFIDMKGRIERQIESRTMMLSGVSHDLRTPLTRMRIAVEMLEEDAEREELARDLAQMERMLDAFLAFARGEQGEAPAPTDPVSLAEEVAASARRSGGDVTALARVDTPEAPLATVRPDALRRAIANLVENAVTFGSRAELSVRLGRRWLEIDVEDDGPGIPADAREAAMRPFHRLDAARNQDCGDGVGLGLAIAAEVARGHGGSLTLGESARLGGLRARLRLPR